MLEPCAKIQVVPNLIHSKEGLFYMKKLFLISVLLLLSIVAVACGGDDGDNENGENANESENENTEQTENAEGENNEGQQEVEEVKADEFPDVVAKVNGEEITNEQLALNVKWNCFPSANIHIILINADKY